MSKCPVCGKEMKKGVCVCGFDESCNYEKYPTLTVLGKVVSSISGSRDDSREDRLCCPVCGEQNFYCDFHLGALVCTTCSTPVKETEIRHARSIWKLGVESKKEKITTAPFCAGERNTVVICSNGQVVARGSNANGCCDVRAWSDITEVAAGTWCTLGLKKDGTVLASGANGFSPDFVRSWRGITAVATKTSHSLGLREDGRVLATGANSYGQCNVSGWTDIRAIAAGLSFSAGLRKNGTVVVAGSLPDDGKTECAGWRDIVAISAGPNHLLGLKKDGNVVAAGWNVRGQCNVQNWSNIVSISAERACSFGLRADGTVVTTDRGTRNRFWCMQSNIGAISSGLEHTVAMTGDGKLIAYGLNNDGQCDLEGITVSCP